MSLNTPQHTLCPPPVSSPQTAHSNPLSMMSTPRILAICLLAICGTYSRPALAQLTSDPQTSNISANTSEGSAILHSVVRWSGTLPQASGRTITLHFSVYANQTGGAPLWTESQNVSVQADGHYSVLLGAATTQGLPPDLFPSDQLRWIETSLATTVENGTSQKLADGPRSLIAAVPYALRSMDTDTLGGRAAADYVTRENLSSLVSSMLPATVQGNTTPSSFGITPNLAGTGTTGTLALWTGSATIGSSNITDSANKIGIGTTAPATTLDVNGTATVRSTLTLPTGTLATASTGQNSPTLRFIASSYSSSSSAAIAQTFALQAVSSGNDTSAPTGKLQFMYASGTGSPVATGLSIAANGRITFASGQTFPGIAGGGTITGVTATSPLTGGGTSGTVTLGLNLSSLETSLNPVYARLAAANNFTSSAVFAGPITGNSGSTMYAIQGNTSSGSGVQGYATGTNGWGVNGYSTGNGGIGVYGNATGNANGTSYPIGVLGHVIEGTAILGRLDESQNGQAAVLGQANGASAVYNSFQSDGLAAGVWGDISDATGVVTMGIAGTSVSGYGGVFENSSTLFPTLYVYNQGSAGTGLPASADLSAAGHFSTMMVGSKGGTCGVSGTGDLTCTGQVKALVSTGGGTRKVETYAVQSPENWIEDFGAGELHSGSAIVIIDPAFAETVSGSAEYHVFITPNGESKGLYVVSKTANSFEVRESGGGTASISFDYRVVAKRRGFEAQRLTDVTESINAEMKAASAPINAGNRSRKIGSQ